MSNIFPINRFSDMAITNVDREFDSLFNTLFGAPRHGHGRMLTNSTVSTTPRANIARNEEGYTIDLAAPGMSREDFIISVENNTLTVSSAVENSKEDELDVYTTKEYIYSSFSRSWTLPKGVNASTIGARYDAGILSLSVPVSGEEAQKLVIDVE